MHRFFTPKKNISAGKAEILEQDTIHHLKDVLWLKAGQEVMIFDEAGNEYRAEIETITPKAAKLKIKEKLPQNNPNKLQVTIACAIPKKSKFDHLIDKLTQLGVIRIIPLITERVVVKLDKHKEALRKTRWDKIALNASEQSKRSGLVVIDAPTRISDLIANSSGFDLKLIPTLEGRRGSLKESLGTVPEGDSPFSIIILIGPEGDFTDDEVASAVNSGFIPVSLGREVLRVETAAVAVASFIKFYGNG
jgi:16S rRNA (uracil1498-N3)-methyltransferase